LSIFYLLTSRNTLTLIIKRLFKFKTVKVNDDDQKDK
jgi:hypothetical protein